MKKILLVIFTLISFYSFSQPVSPRSNSSVTVMDSRWMAQYNLFVPRFPDTLTANNFKGIDTCGAIIFTYDVNGLWYRQCSPKKWVQISSGGSGVTAANNGLTLSGSTVQLRGTLNQATTIDGAGFDFAYNDIGAFGIGATTYSLNAGPGNQLLMNNTRSSFTGANVGIGTTSPSVAFDVNGQMRMRTGATNGYIIQGDGNGVFSWVNPSTLYPTWQQTLTAGSAFNTDNFVSAAGHSFAMSALSEYTIGTQLGSSFGEYYSNGINTEVANSNLAGKASYFRAYSDSLLLAPGDGNLFIDSLTSAAASKVLHYNPVTGRVTYADTTAGSGGTVISVASADGSITVTNPTSTVDLAVVKSPILTTSRTIGIITGDGTSAGSAFNGSANNTNALTLATVNGNVGSFTNASIIVNAKGLITAASSGSTPEVPLSFTSPLVRTVNTIACATCVVATVNPGIGIAHFAGSTQTTTSSLIVNADITNSTIDLTTKVTGTLPIANGGTNNSLLSVTAGTVYYGDGTKLIGLAPGTTKQHLTGGTTPSWKDTTASTGGTLTGFTTFGVTPNANGGSVSGANIILQPADASNPGGVSLSAQTMGAGDKSFSAKVVAPVTSGTSQGLFTGTAAQPLNGIQSYSTGGITFGFLPTNKIWQGAGGWADNGLGRVGSSFQMQNDEFYFYSFDAGITATNRLALITGGNFGVGDATPASLFTVGNGDLFQVNSSGAIASATGIISSGSVSLTGTSIVIPTSASILTLGGGATAAKLRFMEPSASGANYSEFQAVSQAANISYSLPPTVGAAGTVLTDAAGNGVLSWASAGGAYWAVTGTTTLTGNATITGGVSKFTTEINNGNASGLTIGMLADDGTVIGDINTVGNGTIGVFRDSQNSIYFSNTTQTALVAINTATPTVALDVVGAIKVNGDGIGDNTIQSDGDNFFGDVTNNTYLQASGTNANNKMIYKSGSDHFFATGTVTIDNLGGAGSGVVSANGDGLLSRVPGTPVSTISNNRVTGQTAAATLTSYTVGVSDESLMVSANLLITTATVHSFNARVVYTDEGNTSRTLVLNFSTIAGAITPTITNTGGTIPYEGVPLHIRAKAGTTVTFSTAGTFTTVTYNFEGIVNKIN